MNVLLARKATWRASVHWRGEVEIISQVVVQSGRDDFVALGRAHHVKGDLQWLRTWRESECTISNWPNPAAALSSRKKLRGRRGRTKQHQTPLCIVTSPEIYVLRSILHSVSDNMRSSNKIWHCLSKVANMVLSTRISQILAKLIRPKVLYTPLWCFNRNQVDWLFNYFNQISIKYFHLFHVSKVMFWQANVYFINNAVRFKLQSILICMNIVNIGLKMFRTSNQRLSDQIRRVLKTKS